MRPVCQHDFSTLYTTLPHNLIKEKLINLIEWTFKREGSSYIACNERQAFFPSEDTKRYKLWSCQNVCEALIYLLDNIYIRFGTKLYRQIVGIPMGTKSVVNGHCNHLALKFSVCVKERQDRLPTMYWLPKLHKKPYKARFIANSSSCTTTELSKLLTSCLTAVKNHVIRYCEKVYERSGKNLFWSIKNSGEVLNKLNTRGFRATSLSTYDFSTLYTTLPHNLIKEKLINLIEWTFKREGSSYIACNERQAFFTSEDTKRYKLWSCQNVCEALIYLLDNIYIRFGTKLYRQIVGIPMGTNCAPLVADLFLFCYQRDFMTSLSDVKQADIIEAFKSTSRYLDDLFKY